MSSEERLKFSENYPDNFINAMRTVEDLPDGHNISTHTLLTENLSFLRNVLRSDFYQYKATPYFYIYQLKTSDFEQTGIVAEVSMADYQKDVMSKAVSEIRQFLTAEGQGGMKTVEFERADFIAAGQRVQDRYANEKGAEFTAFVQAIREAGN